MFEPISMNQMRSQEPQVPYRRGPFVFQGSNQMPPVRSARNISQLLPGGSGKSLTLSKGMTGATKFLENAQQVLRLVETTAPMIKEYGPMLKNLPTMYKMVKAFKNIDAFTDTMEGNSKEDDKSLANKKKPKEQEKNETELLQRTQGASVPKLYI